MRILFLLSSALWLTSSSSFAGNAPACTRLCTEEKCKNDPKLAQECQTHCDGLGGRYEAIKKICATHIKVAGGVPDGGGAPPSGGPGLKKGPPPSPPGGAPDGGNAFPKPIIKGDGFQGKVMPSLHEVYYDPITKQPLRSKDIQDFAAMNPGTSTLDALKDEYNQLLVLYNPVTIPATTVSQAMYVKERMEDIKKIYAAKKSLFEQHHQGQAGPGHQNQPGQQQGQQPSQQGQQPPHQQPGPAEPPATTYGAGYNGNEVPDKEEVYFNPKTKNMIRPLEIQQFSNMKESTSDAEKFRAEYKRLLRKYNPSTAKMSAHSNTFTERQKQYVTDRAQDISQIYDRKIDGFGIARTNENKKDPNWRK